MSNAFEKGEERQKVKDRHRGGKRDGKRGRQIGRERKREETEGRGQMAVDRQRQTEIDEKEMD